MRLMVVGLLALLVVVVMGSPALAAREGGIRPTDSVHSVQPAAREGGIRPF